MRQRIIYNQDFGAPPPPPPPSMSTPPTPPVSGTGSSGSASTNAIIVLVMGILSYVLCGVIGGIIAWIMGKGELNKIDRGESPEAGRTMAKIGMWLGIINVILTVIAGIFLLIYFVFLAAVIGTNN
ncbi:MAG TPA: DUF4190 domain-containing protein [Ignavibacteria bacterium]|jgi:hypothetical protein